MLGEREIKTTKIQYGGEICLIKTWTNLTKFWHRNEFKKHSMAKRACGKYLEVVLRNNLGGMQRNVTM